MHDRHEPLVADGFFVHVVGEEGGTTVIVSGELDLTTSEALRQHVAVLVDPSARVAIDLRDVTFMDSTGLRALWSIHQNLVANGGHVRLRSPSAAVRRVLDVTALTGVFEITDDARR
jgi:anti-anti-sigma factor